MLNIILTLLRWAKEYLWDPLFRMVSKKFADEISERLGGKATSHPAGEATSATATKIVSKGLRSFDAHDASFFLELLPGPRGPDGLPESIRFWKARIEETDPDKTFRVGVLYGPSGCGKSSLMKAGILPQLADAVIPVYV